MNENENENVCFWLSGVSIYIYKFYDDSLFFLNHIYPGRLIFFEKKQHKFIGVSVQAKRVNDDDDDSCMIKSLNLRK